MIFLSIYRVMVQKKWLFLISILVTTVSILGIGYHSNIQKYSLDLASNQQFSFASLQAALKKKALRAKQVLGANDTAFHEILEKRAAAKTIVLSSVDSGYFDMAVNLYMTSFKKHGIENYLFVGSDPDVCRSLSAFNITCFDYIHDRDGRKASGYFSKAFKRKTHLKTKIILEALRLGLKVLITDVDIVFFKNPLATFTCDSCDIEISSDVFEGNSGFYFVRPTSAAIKLHEIAWKQGVAKPEISNQKTIDRNMEKMVRKKELKVKNLDPKIYTNGKVYFEDGKRMFKGDNPCSKCVIVHNNWIVTAGAKIFRFKECGLWQNDRNRYYSSEEQKYLSFDLPADFGAAKTKLAEKKALQNALIIGEILNRTVILPKFHCYGCKYNGACKKAGARCSLGTFYKIERFDSHVKDRYRESVFLSHDKVPRSVKKSLSPVYFINSTRNGTEIQSVSSSVVEVVPRTPDGASAEEIMEWFGNSTELILRFHSLYDSLKLDSGSHKIVNALRKVKMAFADSDYRQYR